MTRVSENSSTQSLKYALNKTKSKVEDLQLKGSKLRSITKPSDNPVSNVEAMALISSSNNNVQFQKNADFALLNLSVTEKSLEELTEIMVKAKEIAVAQSSDFYNADVRKNIANEVRQLFNQSLAIANKKVGLKHIFSGTNTLTPPFDAEGAYKGDTSKISLEVSRDFFVPTNLTGAEVFFNAENSAKIDNPLKDIDFKNDNPLKKEIKIDDKGIRFEIDRSLASVEDTETNAASATNSADNIFAQLNALEAALENNDPKLVQGLLENFDDSISRLVTLRTRIGSIVNSIEVAKNNLDSENVSNAERKSKLVDADVAELFSDISKQQAILKTTYKATQGVMNQNLMDFLGR